MNLAPNELIAIDRGIINAKLAMLPLGFVRSIVVFNAVKPWALLPNPTKAGTPARPPAIVVREIGPPDANAR